MEDETILDRRIREEYDLQTKNIMKNDKQIVLLQLENLNLKGTSKIFENQELIGSKVVCLFNDRKIVNIMVVSKTQSGKTGSMCATIKKYLEDSNNLIPIENIYVITGHSSCEWKEQTKERMPDSIQNRVFHRCELPNTFADEIKNKKNILIIMDEIQIAAKKGQTIYRAFENANLLDKENLFKNDIKILEYTATPDGTIYDLMEWRDASAKILAMEGNGYTSSFKLLEDERVKQYKKLVANDDDTDEIIEMVFENIREIKADIDKYDYPLYHIIRTKNGCKQELTIDNFRQVFSTDDCIFIKYDRESEIDDINKTLSGKPEKHTFIFIKEMLRCSKTLVKKYIGILYERYTEIPDDSTIIQGLLGRNTGYDDNGVSIVYTNIDSIIKYENLWKSAFDDKTIKWKSKTTKIINGECNGNNTFNNPGHYLKDDSSSVDGSESSLAEEPVIMKFKSCKEAVDYFKTHLKQLFQNNNRGNTRGPNIRKDDTKVNGFFLLGNGRADTPRVRSVEETFNNRKRWFKNNTKKYKLEPCYRDVTDCSTLEWWLIYYGERPTNANVYYVL